MKRLLSLVVNGRRREDAIGESALLLDYLREVLGLNGAKRGCDGGECGACTVLVDGEPALACLTLAARCEGRKVETIEGMASGGRLHARHDHVGRSAAAAQSQPGRGGDPRGARRKPVAAVTAQRLVKELAAL